MYSGNAFSINLQYAKLQNLLTFRPNWRYIKVKVKGVQFHLHFSQYNFGKFI